MAKSDFTTVDKYIASQPKAAQGALRQVRKAIRQAVPEAQETISYKMPLYKLEGNRVLFFAGWKQHYSLYPATKGVLAEFREALRPYEISKGTIRFPLSEPVPTRLIEQIARFRAKEATTGQKTHKTRRRAAGSAT